MRTSLASRSSLSVISPSCWRANTVHRAASPASRREPALRASSSRRLRAASFAVERRRRDPLDARPCRPPELHLTAAVAVCCECRGCVAKSRADAVCGAPFVTTQRLRCVLEPVVASPLLEHCAAEHHCASSSGSACPCCWCAAALIICTREWAAQCTLRVSRGVTSQLVRSWCAAPLILKHSRSHGQHNVRVHKRVDHCSDGRTADGLAAEVSDAS